MTKIRIYVIGAITVTENRYMNLLFKLISDNEQDRAACHQWWREASDVDKLDIWNLIQKTYDDPAMEIMSRFAHLAFCDIAEKESK